MRDRQGWSLRLHSVQGEVESQARRSRWPLRRRQRRRGLLSREEPLQELSVHSRPPRVQQHQQQVHIRRQALQSQGQKGNLDRHLPDR